MPCSNRRRKRRYSVYNRPIVVPNKIKKILIRSSCGIVSYMANRKDPRSFVARFEGAKIELSGPSRPQKRRAQLR